jgi:dTDP-4-dehydrorhamnose reductase
MIVVLGADGMLGRAFQQFYGSRAVYLTRNDCDFTDYSKLYELLNSIGCSVVINCAAIIDFNYIERFEGKSFEVNSLLPQRISQYCARGNIKYVHISTDHFYVDNLEIHSESSPVSLVNKYAEHKFVAERLVLNACPKSLVARVSLLGYKNLDGATLIEWILKTLKYKKSISGFYDAMTSSLDVGVLCVHLDKAISQNLSGIYNIGTKFPYSKYDLIEAVILELGLKDILLIKKSVGSLAVFRANNCGLDISKFAKDTLSDLPTLDQVIKNLNLEEVYNDI